MDSVRWEDRHQPCNLWLCCQKSLYSLSLVSKSMATPAQRALFSKIVLDKPLTLVNLAKSILLYPETRGYIRHIGVDYYQYMRGCEYPVRLGEVNCHNTPQLYAFHNLLGLVLTAPQAIQHH